MRNSLVLSLGIALAFAAVRPAQAAIHLSSGAVDINPGQTIDIPVLITADSGTPNLMTFNLGFTVNTTNGLSFTVTQPTLTPSTPNYIFNGQATAGYSSFGDGSSLFFANDTTNQAGGSNYTNSLLATMRVNASNSAVLNTFNSIADGGSVFVSPTSSLISFDSNFGQVHIVAVPEPSPVALAGVGSLLAGATAYLRQRSRRKPA
ncbi:MAG: hypothetical protein U0835_01280 [Isosphaeraceae bacterium]